ncbi:MAG: SPASM domain-containing protein [Acidobacteriota bacterium]|nr:SPASM domain-containing protein [Acidobacteriota bacterium]
MESPNQLKGKPKIEKLNFNLSSDLNIKKKGNEYLIVNGKHMGWMRSNRVGMDIIKSYFENPLFTEIVDKIAKCWDVPARLIEEDVRTFLEKAKDARIIGDKTAPMPGIVDLKFVWIHLKKLSYRQCQYGYACNDSEESEHIMTSDELARLFHQLNNYQLTQLLISSDLETLQKEHLIDCMKIATNPLNLILDSAPIGIDMANILVSCFKSIQINIEIENSSSVDLAIENVKMLKKAGLKSILISALVNEQNISKLSNILEPINDSKCTLEIKCLIPAIETETNDFSKRCNFISVFQQSRELFYSFLLKKKKVQITLKTAGDMVYSPFNTHKYLNCGLGINTLSISPDGSVYPCPLLHDHKYKIGNTYVEDFSEINKKASEIYQEVTVDKFKNCSACEYRYYCGGGCRVLALEFGSLTENNPCCDCYKNVIEEVMWTLGK